MASKSGKPTAAKRKAKGGKTRTKAADAKPKAGASKNPLLAKWTTPFEMPPFDRVKAKHFMPAFDQAFADNIAEIEAIASEPAKPTFANTIEALERAGRGLDRAAGVFYNLAGDRHQRRDAEDRARGGAALRQALHARLSERQAVPPRRCACSRRRAASASPRSRRGCWSATTAASSAPARRSTPRHASGWRRSPSAWRRSAPSSTRTCWPTSRSFCWCWKSEAELAGLPEAVRAAAAQTASERGHKGKHAISLSRSSIEPFLQFSARRDLREQAFKAWRQRGANGGKTDNRKIVAEILNLRAERSRLLGFKTAADAALEFTMAKTPANVRKLLMEVWKPARKRAAEERDAAAAGRAGRRRQLQAGRLGLALLRGKGAQDQVRRRRGGGEALPAARQRHRCRVRRRQQAVRRELQGAPRPAGVSPRRAQLRGDRRGRPPCRAVPGRLLLAALEALRRLDVGLARPAQARRRTRCGRSSSTS